MRRIIAFIICTIAVVLPYRLRTIFSEILGWIMQFLYLLYYVIFKCIIDNLVVDKKEKG